MKKELEYCTSDKVNWFKNHAMSEEQRKKMIEDKLKRALKQVELETKTKVLVK
jgi:hypothetical protein